MAKQFKPETLCVQAGWTPKKGEPRVLPIYQSTTFKYETSEQMARLFDLEDSGYFYTRLQNPTNDAVAAKIAALEGGVGAMLTSSGQAANFYAIFNICQAGDHFVCSSAIYGGTFNLFGVTMKKLGIDVTFVSPDAGEEEISAAFRPNTKALFGETISNPSLEVLDIEKFARIAHSHGVPLIVDNTFPTPINCRPFEWGADIVVHSTTKYMDGHATSVGGCIVDSGNFAARFRKAFNAAFDVVVEKYKGIVLFFIKRRWLTGSLLIASIALLVVLMNTTKTSLVPDEDQGVIFVNVSTAAGSSLRTTDDVMKRIEERMEQIPQVKHVQKVAGYGLLAGQGSSFGMLILKLKPWDERPGKEDDVQAVIGQVYGRTADIKDASVFAISPGMIPGYGMGNALELHMQDKTGGDVNEFFQTTQQYLGALNQRPEIAMAYSTFDVRYPQWLVEVDPSKCKRAGITPDQVLSTLSGYYGGQYVSNFNRFSKVYKVMIQSDPQYRLDEASLNNTFVRMSNGEMAPLSQFLTLTRTYGAESLSRFNMYNSIAVNAMPADGYSTGDAIRAVQETASTSLPKGYGYDYGGITREENQQSGTTAIIFGICFLMIYLILSALYESFLIPFAVLLSVPCGLMGSFLFARMFGLENNIYLQTGLIMLIGLLAKTAS
jgi:hypothetical protein